MKSYNMRLIAPLRLSRLESLYLERQNRQIGNTVWPDPPTMEEFVMATTPHPYRFGEKIQLEAWQQKITARLQRLTKEKGQRILIHKPPQYGGSILISQRFPAYSIGVNPLRRVRLVTYNIEHSVRFSLSNQRVVESDEFQKFFPNPACRLGNIVRNNEWYTNARESKNDSQPTFVALGLGSGFTGLGVDDLIIDDPYKDRDEAFSLIVNTNIRNWWKETAAPRVNPETNVIVMFHRYKEDDFAGFLMASGKWEVMRFPAIADGLAHDCSDMPVGEALSPRFSVKYLREEVEGGADGMGEAGFSTLYQGMPKPRDGVMVKEQWLQKQSAGYPVGAYLIRYWDKGFTDRGGAYTAGVLMAMQCTWQNARWGTNSKGAMVPLDAVNGESANLKDVKNRGYWKREFWVVDVVRGQWGEGERDNRIYETAVQDRMLYGNVSTWIEKEPGALGRDSNRVLLSMLAGFDAHGDPVGTDKVERALPYFGQLELGSVTVCEGEWRLVYCDEVKMFPNGKFKDQVDASSGAFNRLVRITPQQPVNDLDLAAISRSLM